MKVFIFVSVINTCFCFMIKRRVVADLREIVTVLSLYSSYVVLTSGQFYCMLGSVGFIALLLLLLLFLSSLSFITIVVLIDFHRTCPLTCVNTSKNFE